MKIFELAADPTLEAAMNPGAFAGAVAQGTGQGVQVGYEFEVCVPRQTISGPSITRSAKDVQEYIQYNRALDDLEYNEEGFDKFLDVFKFRNPKIPYRSLPEAREQLMQKQLPAVIAAYEQIPERTLKKYRDQSMEDLQNLPNYNNMSSTEKQFWFAHNIGKEIYYRGRGDSALRGRDLRNISQNLNTANGVLQRIFGYNTEYDIGGVEVHRNFNKLFDYDPNEAWNFVNEYIHPYDDEEADDNDYQGAVKVLKPALEQTYGTKVTVFREYHQKKKNLTDWYIEPDGSLDPSNPGDGAAEVVSPPMPAATAMDALNKFYVMAKQLNLYTNDSTGIHINVSIPEKIDILKLAVFLGDQYVLRYFGRSNSEYAQSVMQHLRNPSMDAEFTGTKNNMALLQSIAKGLARSHWSSISNNGKYISFRHAGGDYLNDPQAVTNTVGRFVNAMLIAADPAAYKNEYMTKLAKLFPGNAPEANNSELQTVLAQVRKIRQEGLPVAIKDLGYYRPVPPQPSISAARQQQQNNPLISREVGSQAAKTAMLAAESESTAGTNNHQYPLLRKAPATQFVREIYSVVNGVGWALDTDGVDIRWDYSKKSFFTVSQATLPPTDPRVINYIKQLTKPLLNKKKNESQ